MENAETRVVDHPEANRFEIFVGEELAGFSEYKRTSSKLSIMHTEIDPRFEGRGLGSALARGVLDIARAEGRPVLPFCPFFRGYIKRHPGYLDLVPPEQRARFGLADTAEPEHSA